MDFSSLKSCTELRDAHIVAAVESSDSMSALLDRFVAIAAPGKGAPVILAALARMGTTACEWVDGELRVEITGDAEKTKIACSSSIGGGFRERLFPDKVLRVPFEEFPRMVKRVPKLIEPLVVKETERSLVLSVTAEVRKTTMPPPMVAIDPGSLLDVSVPKAPKPPPLPKADPLEGAPASDGPKIVLRKRVREDGPK